MQRARTAATDYRARPLTGGRRFASDRLEAAATASGMLGGIEGLLRHAEQFAGTGLQVGGRGFVQQARVFTVDIETCHT